MSGDQTHAYDYDPHCPGGGRVTPVWTDYQMAFLTNFGVVEVPTPAPVIV